MEKAIEKFTAQFMDKGHHPALAATLAQTRVFANEFKKLHNELIEIRKILVANYGENALLKMNNDE